MNPAKIRYKVVPGAIRMDGPALVRPLGPNAAEWRFDLDSKYAQYACCACNVDRGYPLMVGLCAGDGSMHIDETKRGVLTQIFWNTPKGWDVLSAEVSRYTLTVVMGKRAADRQWHQVSPTYPRKTRK